MTPHELRTAIRFKTAEIETAEFVKKPHQQVLTLYKELKELQFRLLQAEQRQSEQDLVSHRKP